MLLAIRTSRASLQPASPSTGNACLSSCKCMEANTKRIPDGAIENPQNDGDRAPQTDIRQYGSPQSEIIVLFFNISSCVRLPCESDSVGSETTERCWPSLRSLSPSVWSVGLRCPIGAATTHPIRWNGTLRPPAERPPKRGTLHRIRFRRLRRNRRRPPSRSLPPTRQSPRLTDRGARQSGDSKITEGAPKTAFAQLRLP